MADDLLDYAGTAAIGKNLGDDFRERKVTLPVIRAVEAEPEARDFWIRVIEKGDQRHGDLAHALDRMQATGALDSTAETARDWSAQARAALAPLPDHPLKEVLSDLADHVVSRIT
jgi:octaprenyl-diphosphate synthase